MAGLTLIIGNKNYSSWSLRPWLLLRHHGVDFEEKRVPLFTDVTARELARFDSDYKVPVLVHGDLVIWDSLSIVEYVSETCLHGRGWPDGRDARAVARSVSAEMHSSFSAVRSELPMNCRKTFENVHLSQSAQREIDRVKAIWRHCRERFGAGGEWLFGDFSIADAMFAPMVLRFAGYRVPLSGTEADYARSVLKHPALAEWIGAARLETEVIEDNEIDN